MVRSFLRIERKIDGTSEMAKAPWREMLGLSILNVTYVCVYEKLGNGKVFLVEDDGESSHFDLCIVFTSVFVKRSLRN